MQAEKGFHGFYRKVLIRAQLNFICNPIAKNDPIIIIPGAVINTGPYGRFVGGPLTVLNGKNNTQCSSGMPWKE